MRANELSGSKRNQGGDGREGGYAMMRTSLRTCWRTIGHDDLDLRLRRALAHGSFDTSSIFYRPEVGNTRPPLPTATQSSVPFTLFRYPREIFISIVAGSSSRRMFPRRLFFVYISIQATLGKTALFYFDLLIRSDSTTLISAESRSMIVLCESR